MQLQYLGLIQFSAPRNADIRYVWFSEELTVIEQHVVGATVSYTTPACTTSTQIFSMDYGQAKRHQTKQITSHYNLKKEAAFLFALQWG